MDEPVRLTPAVKAALEAGKPPPQPWDRPAGIIPGYPENGIAANVLYEKEFADPKYVIDGLIGDGLSILCGKPKRGKSWMSLMWAWAVAAGYEINGRQTWQGEVLYLALEDTQRRIQSRMRMLNKELGWIVPETLTIHTEWPRADNHGLWYCMEWIMKHGPQARFIVIDTLAKFRKPAKGNGNAYADDDEATGGLKKVCDKMGVSGLFNHHTRKLRAEDPFDEISGSYGISGPADTLIVLENEGPGKAKLFTRGRDIAESTTPIEFRTASGLWVLKPSKEGIDTEGRMVMAGDGKKSLVEACADWLKEFLATEAYPSDEITEAARQKGHSFNSLKMAKNRLGSKGTGEITHHNFSTNGVADWWSGIGQPIDWRRRRVPIEKPKNESSESSESTSEIPP